MPHFPSTGERPASKKGEAHRMRIAILQRVCPAYRVALFSALSMDKDTNVRLFIGDDIPKSKVKSAPNLGYAQVTRLKTKFLKLGRRTLPWHLGLVDALREFEPDVILCEGESHFLGYLQAMYYRAKYNTNVALVHWCFTTLPGKSNRRTDIAALVKTYFRRYFDAFVAYSTYSKQCLVELGEPAEKIFVATNVGDVNRFLSLSDALHETGAEARLRLGLPERFTVLYSGTLDENKRPNVMLDLASECDSEQYSFVLVGSGPLLQILRERAVGERLSNVFLPGRVTEELALYYRAADVLLVPGRGGIVMSEAMAGGVPVIVHQADGTEFDLVEPEITGLRVSKGSTEDFAEALELLGSQPDLCVGMGTRSKEMVRCKFNARTMTKRILRAASFAHDSRMRATNSRAMP